MLNCIEMKADRWIEKRITFYWILLCSLEYEKNIQWAAKIRVNDYRTIQKIKPVKGFSKLYRWMIEMDFFHFCFFFVFRSVSLINSF